MIRYLRQADEEAVADGAVDHRVIMLLREADAYLAGGRDHHVLEVTRAYGGWPMSVIHDAGRAADIRTRDLDRGTIDDLVEHLCRVFPRAAWDPYRTALYEVPGPGSRATGPHLHVQVPPYPTPWWRVEMAMPAIGDVVRSPERRGEDDHE